MLRYGYDRRLATGVIAASGTLAQIIPPSLVLIVMADQLGRSVGDMYEGAIIPGLVLTVLYAGYVLLITLILPQGGTGAADRGASPSARTMAGTASPRSACCWRSPPSSPTSPAGCLPTASRAATGIFGVAIAVGFAFLVAVINYYHRLRPAVAAGRAGGVRAGAAAGADLPGAGHDLRRHRHADRGWRDGCRRCPGAGADEAAPQPRPDEAGDGFDGQAVGLRHLHPDRRPGVLAHLLWRQWPQMGRGAAGRPAGRRGRLPDRRQHPGVRARPSSSTSSSWPSSSCRCSARRRSGWAST